MKKILVLIIIGLLCLSTFSILAPQIKAQEGAIFGDDFESYEVGTFPSAGGWVLVYDGMGAEHQKVINTVSVSGLQSFQLWGQYMWSACSRRSFSTDATIIGYEINVRVEDYGTYWLNAFFSLWSDATETDYMQMSFHSDGKIYVYSYVPIWYSGEPPGPMYDLETTYEPDTWYNIRVIVNRETNIFNVWINNVLKGENLQTKDSFALNALRLGSSHAEIPVYYDDVKVFALSPPKLLAMFSYAEYIIDQAWTFPNGTTFTFRGWLQSKGYSVSTVSEAFPTGEITLSGLQEFQALLVFGDFFADPANIPFTDTVLTYLNLGGGLILFGQASLPSITFDEELGFRWSGSAHGPVDPWSFYVDAGITDYSHPVMQGITELPKAGGVFIDWDTLIDETPLPTGTAVLARTIGSGGPYDPNDRIALIAFQYGDGKVVAGPWDGLVRPYGPTAVNPWDVISEPVVENKLLPNAISWVSQAIVNQPPVADFRYRGPKTSFTPSTIYVGSEVKFDAEPSHDLDGPNQNPVSYTWDFGDGSDLLTIAEEVTYHTYVVSGPYTVTLRVTDDKGATGETSEDIFIYPYQWRLFVEIDYMTDHEPTDSVLTYIERYYRDNGINLLLHKDDEVTDPTPDDGVITRNDFWTIENSWNDVFWDDDRAFGNIINAKFYLKEKWVLFGTIDGIPGHENWHGYTTLPSLLGLFWPDVSDTGGNYIFVADEYNDEKASEWAGVVAEKIETVVLMHELGHSIGILKLRLEPSLVPLKVWVEDCYGRPSWSVMSITSPNNCNTEPIRYSPPDWRLRNMEYYEI